MSKNLTQPTAILDTDKQGYLKNSHEWTPAIGELIAQQEGLVLTVEHWTVIEALREFYLQHQLTPAMRALVKQLQGKIVTNKNISLYLQSLFPNGLMRQGSKIAGLPKPVRCI